jgi:hypothetical protein
MNPQEHLQTAIAEQQYRAALEAWMVEPPDDSPRRACLAARITHWKRVLEALGAF